MTTAIKTNAIKRHGRTILIGGGLTATECHDGLPTLTFRRGGKIVDRLRGSSLVFSTPLSDDDREYLASLAEKY